MFKPIFKMCLCVFLLFLFIFEYVILNIAINLLKCYTDFECHIGFAQQIDFYDYPIYFKRFADAQFDS